MDPGSALVKLRALCAKQERCRSELMHKLKAWGVEDEAVLDQLVTEGFLNERRFAGHFAVSKLRQNGWGRIKIRRALEEKGLSEADIDAGLGEVDEGEYRDTLRKLAARHGTDAHRFLTGRGFEEEILEEVLRG